jgi:hypothetical protein
MTALPALPNWTGRCGKSVSIVIRLRASIPGRSWNFFSSPQLCPDLLLGSSSLLSNVYRGFFPEGIKWPGREADHHLHLVPRLIRVAMPSLLNTSSRGGA